MNLLKTIISWQLAKMAFKLNRPKDIEDIDRLVWHSNKQLYILGSYLEFGQALNCSSDCYNVHNNKRDSYPTKPMMALTVNCWVSRIGVVPGNIPLAGIASLAWFMVRMGSGEAGEFTTASPIGRTSAVLGLLPFLGVEIPFLRALK